MVNRMNQHRTMHILFFNKVQFQLSLVNWEKLLQTFREISELGWILIYPDLF